jgi:major type 1 subunit fimbrin (pilin)
MNKTLVATALGALIATAGAIPVAQATDGTINITGSVVSQTCKVEGNDFGTPATKAVPLAPVLATDLAVAGNTAQKTPFSLAITNCDSALTSVQAYFSGANIDPSTGNLTLSGGASATNVQIQLLNASGAVMPLNGATATAQNSQVVALSGGAATLDYSAQYVAVGGAATAGAANTSVQFTMNYL